MGVGDGQGGLACCSPWGRKESDTTEQLNWTIPGTLNRRDSLRNYCDPTCCFCWSWASSSCPSEAPQHLTEHPNHHRPTPTVNAAVTRRIHAHPTCHILSWGPSSAASRRDFSRANSVLACPLLSELGMDPCDLGQRTIWWRSGTRLQSHCISFWWLRRCSWVRVCAFPKETLAPKQLWVLRIQNIISESVLPEFQMCPNVSES